MQDIMELKIPITKLVFDLNRNFFEGVNLFNKTGNTKDIITDLLSEDELSEDLIKNVLNLVRKITSSSESSIEQSRISMIEKLSSILNRDYITIDDILNSKEEPIQLLNAYFSSILNNIIKIDKVLSKKEFYENFCFVAIAFLRFEGFKLKDNRKELSDLLDNYIGKLISNYIDDYYLSLTKNNELNNSIIELININKNLKVDNKSIKKELEITNRYVKTEISQLISSDLNKNINKFSTTLDNCIKDIKDANYKTLKNSYESLLNQSEEKISNNKLLLSEKNNEIKSLKQNQTTKQNIFSYIKENIEDINFKDELLNVLDIDIKLINKKTQDDIYIDDFTDVNIKNEEINNNIYYETNNKDTECKKSLIGYCEIYNDTHFAVLSNKKEIEIKGLPNGLYLGQGQFVNILNDGTFIKNYDYYVQNSSDFNVLPDSSLIEINTNTKNNEEFYYTMINDNKVEIKSANSGFIIYDNSIGVINRNNIIVRLFKRFKYNIDSLINSILAKKHKPYFVLSVDEKIITVKNILTKEVEIYDKNFNYNREILPLNTIILDDKNNLISMFSASKFYTSSSFYDNKKYININMKNEDIEVYDCITGENLNVILNINKDKLSDKQSYVIDEYGNIIDILSDLNLMSDIEKKNKYKKQKINFENNPITIKKRVLIVGDKGYENTYKINLYKYGYIVKVIDGFDSWKKIQMELKNIDVIIAVPNYMSHDNFYKIKDTLTDTDVIISSYDGANRLVDLLEEKYEAVI